MFSEFLYDSTEQKSSGKKNNKGAATTTTTTEETVDDVVAVDSDTHNSKKWTEEEKKKKGKELGDILISDKESIANKMRTCFLLKQLGGIHAIEALNRGFVSESSLLKHEICYVLGQMRDKDAFPYLIQVLVDQDHKHAAIVRHEAAEAMAAIGFDEQSVVMSLLKKFSNDESLEVAQTCQLALDSYKWTKQNHQRIPISKMNSVDPAPPYPDDIVHSKNNNSSNININNNNNNNNNTNSNNSVKNKRNRRKRQNKKKNKRKNKKPQKTYKELELIFLDEKQSMFERYRAMFTLRDLNTKEAIEILCKGFFTSPSALFKHEIAFVLGQMMNELAIDSLIHVLKNESEHEMVRHEAAEALGAIAKDQILPILNEYKNDKQRVVKESCEVALDMHEYWNNEEVDNVFE